MEAQAHDLESHHAQDRREHRGHTSCRSSTESYQPHQHRKMKQQSHGQKHGARHEEQLVGRVEKHHAEAAPAVPECAKLRFTLSRSQDDRDLTRPEPREPGIDGGLPGRTSIRESAQAECCS